MPKPRTKKTGRGKKAARNSTGTSQETNNLSNGSDSLLSPEEMERMAQLSNEVFENPLIREIILDYTVHKSDNENELDRKTICALRLCRKSWNKPITEICLKSHQPLYKLILNKTNSLEGTQYVTQNGKLLDQISNHFDTIIENSSGIIPTMSLKIHEDFFRQENHSSLENFLSQFGTKLVELEVLIPESGGSLQCIFPHFNFPLLRKIIFRPSKQQLSNLGSEDQAANNLSHLLYYLLNGAQILREFIIPRNSTANGFLNFQYMRLPSSLTKIELGFALKTADFEVLLKNQFPNLAHIEFPINRNPVDDGVLFRVLENVKTSLKTITISGIMPTAPQVFTPTQISFPVMEKLEKIFSSSVNLVLAPDANNLQLYFPKLRELCLCNQTMSSVRKWMSTSMYTTVKNLTISMSSEQGGNVRGLSIEAMQSVHQSCPSLRSLTVIVNGIQTCGLKHIFTEMKQLTCLVIVVLPMAPTIETMSSDYWDALFIGAPIEFVAALRINPDFCENVQLNDEKLPGIKNMTNLERLFLADKTRTEFPRSDDTETKSLVSDLAFNFAFMKMPKIRSLSFGGKFRASEKMIQMWRSQKRRFQYTDS